MASTWQIRQEQYNQAYRYCISLTGNESDAFDLLQTAFEKFLKISSGRNDLNKGYFYRVIRNQFFDDNKKKKIRQHENIDNMKNIALVGMKPFEDELIDKDEVEAILGKISSDERELLYLSAVEEYSLQEISDMTQIPRGTLLSRLHRLKLRIRNRFQSRIVGGEDR